MTTWWVWLLIAAAFGALEVLLPVFAFLGFAAGATVVGLALLIGDPGAGWALLLFAVVSAAAYLGLRIVLGRDGGNARIITRDINEDP